MADGLAFAEPEFEIKTAEPLTQVESALALADTILERLVKKQSRLKLRESRELEAYLINTSKGPLLIYLLHKIDKFKIFFNHKKITLEPLDLINLEGLSDLLLKLSQDAGFTHELDSLQLEEPCAVTQRRLRTIRSVYGVTNRDGRKGIG